MHQDQRIGLALGVLLIGACAALFFRNETRELPATPRLQRAQELDDWIAERSTRPYLKGIEIVEAANQPRTRHVSQYGQEVDGTEDHVGSSWSPVDAFTGKKSKNLTGRGGPTASLIDADVEELAPIRVPVPQGLVRRGNAITDPPEGRSGSARPLHDTESHSRVHVVQRGETLSSIASKVLGSSSRFQELFAANQDQLKDPNDVRVGMTLRLPEAQDVSSRGAVQGPSLPDARSKSPVTIREIDIEEATAGVTVQEEKPGVLAPPLSAGQQADSQPTQGPREQPETPLSERKFQPAKRFTHLAKPFQSQVGRE
ncbi:MULTISPECIES: LysM peptidoglycan-binding domain-containing protein [unclassified Schlesneria]|uniref:LysM peptidoglycan-binding domain-containing protein n=1 Tax=Schlesneria TaxID=656899 RepID=UPI0035A15C98